MDKINHYRQLVQHLLTEKAERSNHHRSSVDESIVAQTIFDIVHDHYLLVYVGWRGQGEIRQYGCVLHIDIIGAQVWIQQDGTEDGFADALLEHGVPRSDIVLGFLTPLMRQVGEFSVGAAS